MKALTAIALAPLLLVISASAHSMDHSSTQHMAPLPESAEGSQSSKEHQKHDTPKSPGSMTEPPQTESGESKEIPWPDSVPPNAGNSGQVPAMDESKMDRGNMDHSQMPGMQHMPGMEAEEDVGQEAAPAPPEDHAADRLFGAGIMADARSQLRKEHGGETFFMVMLNLAEYQIRNGEDGYRWEGEAWFGGDINRFVFKTEGEGGVRSGVGAGEIQGLYSRAISPYFDLQAGIRQDLEPTPRRTYFAVGVEGLAPYWFETNASVFLSTEGDLLARLEGTYDFRLSQRLILQPRAELNLAAQDIPEIDIGAGLSNLELGLRLRYEVWREFAPYIGISLDRRFGQTATFARLNGEEVSKISFVFGVRAWF